MNNIPIWGLAIGAIGLLFKSWEYYRDRYRTKILFSSGNREYIVTIVNLWSKPIVITYFELFLKDKKGQRRDVDTGTYEGCNISIPSNASHVITIDDQYYFSIPANSKLYITLNIAGRRTIRRQLH